MTQLWTENGERTVGSLGLTEQSDEMRSTPECEHLSASGVDQTALDDPRKVWRCDECGWRYRVVVEGGFSRMVDVDELLCRVHPDTIATHSAEMATATKQPDGRYVEDVPFCEPCARRVESIGRPIQSLGA